MRRGQYKGNYNYNHPSTTYHHHVHHHYHHGPHNSGGETFSNSATSFETKIDGMSNTFIQTFVGNEIYHLRGSHAHVIAHLNS
jgi:hypothetical protein